MNICRKTQVWLKPTNIRRSHYELDVNDLQRDVVLTCDISNININQIPNCCIIYLLFMF